MVACSRARASSRAMLSSPVLTDASWAITLARSSCVAGKAGASTGLTSRSPAEASTVELVLTSAVESESAGPRGRLSRSRTLASSEKLLRMIRPLAPLLLWVDEDIALCSRSGHGDGRDKIVVGHRRWQYDAHRMDRGNGPPMSDDQGLRTLVVVAAEGTGSEWRDGLLGFFLRRVR